MASGRECRTCRRDDRRRIGQASSSSSRGRPECLRRVVRWRWLPAGMRAFATAAEGGKTTFTGAAWQHGCRAPPICAVVGAPPRTHACRRWPRSRGWCRAIARNAGRLDPRRGDDHRASRWLRAPRERHRNISRRDRAAWERQHDDRSRPITQLPHRRCDHSAQAQHWASLTLRAAVPTARGAGLALPSATGHHRPRPASEKQTLAEALRGG